MRVVEVWRYPVKSMAGERVGSAAIDATGLAGDRRWAVVDTGTGRVVSAKRDGRLLEARATLRQPDGPPRVVLPGGRSFEGPGTLADRLLSNWLRRDVRLGEATTAATPVFESQADPDDDASTTATWDGRPGAFVDSTPLHLLSVASLRAATLARPDLDWRVARFRPNLLVEASGHERVEDTWVGRRVTVGDTVVEIVKPCTRCVMVTRAQPATDADPTGLPRQTDVLRHLATTAETTLGVLARVVRSGSVREGAAVSIS